MMATLIEIRLRPVANRLRWAASGKRWAEAFAAAAGVGAGLAVADRGWNGGASGLWMALWMAAGFAAAFWRPRPAPPDLRSAVRRLEAVHPDLDGALITAVEQQPDERGVHHFLQRRLLATVLAHSERHPWREAVPASELGRVAAFNLAAILACALAWRAGRTDGTAGAARPRAVALAARAVEVSPGDVEIEKGGGLVVLARFGGALPAGADLILVGGQAERRLPLVKSLADPAFGGTAPDVSEDFSYRVEYGGRRTRDYRVHVFEHPRLERADAELTYPEYTRQAPKRLEDTRRITAVGGSRIDLSLQLNKPVVSASLAPRDRKGTVLPLTVSSNRAAASLDRFVLTRSETLELRLVDADGRTNKVPARFFLEAVSNRPPELRLASPQGDTRPSPIEEITFAGTVWDDFGVSSYGLAFTQAGRETRLVELGRDVKARDKQAFSHVLRLEDLGMRPGQLLTWYAWADDVGPDGRVRRTSGDLFFAEVRPFDEIFREGQSDEGSDQEQGAEGGRGNPSAKLAELEKQIVNATWKLVRTPAASADAAYRTDAGVVQESQVQALAQATAQAEKAANPQAQASWKAVTREMDAAVKRLSEAEASPAPLPKALAAEQAAYQALLAMAAREHQVSRQKGRGQGQGQGQQASQRQTDQLDLKASDRRYETQRQAKAPANAEQKERLQALSRLQELARRQQDLNERLKEMQTALQEARSPAEQEQRRRELKRLEEEQRQMTADADELRQRMDRPENQASMSDERRRLDQARDQLQQAADAAAQGSPTRALAAGARAQRELQQLREELRRQSSSQFADDVRDLRSQARELERRQEEISKKLEAGEAPGRRTLADGGDQKELLDQLARQKAQAARLTEQAAEVSRQAETAEPLLSERLYDTLRKFSQDDGAGVKRIQEQLARRGLLTRRVNEALDKASEKEGSKSLETVSALLEQGLAPQAGEAGRQAGAQITELKRGVERAAESVLGDDTEALREAARDLDAAARQMQDEIARQQGVGTNRVARAAGAEARAGAPGSTEGSGGDPASGRPEPGAGQGSQARDGQASAAGASASSASPSGTAGGQPGGEAGAQGGGGGRGGRDGQAGMSAGGQAGGPQGGRPADPAGRDSGGGRGEGPRRLAGGRPNGAGGPGAGGGAGDAGGGMEGGGDDGGGLRGSGPLTGGAFTRWSDNLRDVEQVIDDPVLRNQVAAARDRARVMRLDFKRNGNKPDWAVVQLQVVKPLVEARSRIADELARRDSKESLAPVDRDPPPVQFSERVERYFENLGRTR